MSQFSMTFSEMQTELGDGLGFTLDATSRITLTEGKRWLNQGLLDVVVKTGCLGSEATFSVVKDQEDYGLSNLADFLRVDEERGGIVYYDGSSHIRIVNITPDELDRAIPYWRDEASSDPDYYWIHQKQGVWHISFYPKPDTSRTDNTTIHYVQKPEKLVSDTDVMEASISQYWDLPVLYASSKALRKDGEVEKSREAMAEYIDRLKAIRTEMRPIEYQPNI